MYCPTFRVLWQMHFDFIFYSQSFHCLICIQNQKTRSYFFSWHTYLILLNNIILGCKKIQNTCLYVICIAESLLCYSKYIYTIFSHFIISIILATSQLRELIFKNKKIVIQILISLTGKIKGITHGGFYIYINYHYALSRDMTHAALGFHASCVKYCRPFDGSMMYTGIDF